MATSNSHRFGQIIGEVLELAVEPFLEEFADKHNLYLDRKGERLTRTGKKLTWIDNKENKHDLDFVLERGGTDSKLGTPVAFIETAWRRYTKHSRNKAQEIQGAILPLLDKYNHVSPYAGVVLAGEFTQGSLTQLKSLGFSVLYFPYKSVLEAFGAFDIDASSEENTPEEEFKAKIEAVEKVGTLSKIGAELVRLNEADTKQFFSSLEQSVSRHIISILILPLHGNSANVTSVQDAIKFLQEYSEDSMKLPFVKYEIIIKYNTGTKIDAVFATKQEAIEFLGRNASV